MKNKARVVFNGSRSDAHNTDDLLERWKLRRELAAETSVNTSDHAQFSAVMVTPVLQSDMENKLAYSNKQVEFSRVLAFLLDTKRTIKSVAGDSHRQWTVSVASELEDLDLAISQVEELRRNFKAQWEIRRQEIHTTKVHKEQLQAAVRDTRLSITVLGCLLRGHTHINEIISVMRPHMVIEPNTPQKWKSVITDVLKHLELHYEVRVTHSSSGTHYTLVDTGILTPITKKDTK